MTPPGFGALVTVDHAVLGSLNQSSRNEYTVALVAQGHATKWIVCYPSSTKSAQGTQMRLLHFVGSDGKSLGFEGMGTMSCRHLRAICRGDDVSTPERPQPNGVAEQAVRRALEGMRSRTLLSGLPHTSWYGASQAFCALRSVSDRVDDQKTP